MASLGFQADSQGFLTGTLVDTQRDLLRTQQQGLTLWRGIRSDVKALARAIGVQKGGTGIVVPAAPRASMGNVTSASSVARMPVATPAGRAGAARSAPAVAAAVQARSSPRPVAVAGTQQRAANGQFTAGQGKGQSKDEATKGSPHTAIALNAAAQGLSRAAGALGQAAGGLENMDATMAATKEVTDVVAPLGRGLSGLFGRSSERKKERWYNRIWTSLKKIEKKDDEKATVVNNGGGSGLLGSVLGGLGGKGLGALGGVMGGLMGGLKGLGGLVKRLPVLGALFAGGSALFSAFGGEDDPNASPEENRSRRYRNTGQAVGMGAGGLVGAALGSVLGPAGTLAGGFIGSLIGEKIGGAVGTWTKSMIDSGLPERIASKWGEFTAFASGAWGSLTTDFRAAWDGITATASEWWTATKDAATGLMDKVSSMAEAANDWIKEKTGIDAKEAASSAWNKAKEWGSAALEKGKTVAAAMVPETVKRAAKAGSAAAAQVKAGYHGARGEPTDVPAPSTASQRAARSVGTAAGGVAGMISKHEGDYGSFNRGNAGDARGAKIDFSQMTVADVMAQQALPKGHANRLFAVGKYQMIPSTMKSAVKTLGLTGEEKLTPELQERMFSEYLADKKRPEIAGYIKGKHDSLQRAQIAGAQEWASIADPRTGRSFYAGSGNNKAGLSAEKFGGGLESARSNYRELIAQGVDERTAYARALRAGTPTAAATTNAPRVPQAGVPVAAAVQIPPTPEAGVPERLSSAASAAPVVMQQPAELSQDVRDRRLAQIVSGGITPA